MSAFAAAAQDEDGDKIKELQERLQDALECIRKLSAESVNVRAAINRLHAAKGRYHTQIACCDLFDLFDLKTERPKK